MSRATFFDGHSFKKGKFTTPMNQMKETVDMRVQNWSYERMPEYLWIGLILKRYTRTQGFLKMKLVLDKLRELAPSVRTPKMSLILGLVEKEQREFFQFINQTVGIDALKPLSLFLTISHYPVFSSIYGAGIIQADEHLEEIANVMKEMYQNQAEFTTDVKYMVVYYSISCGTVLFHKELANGMFENLNKYAFTQHSEEIMRELRPTVRSLEGNFSSISVDNVAENAGDSNFAKLFWNKVSKMSDCELLHLNFETEEKTIEKANKVLSLTRELLCYYTDILKAFRTDDDKLLVLLGIATYAYKRFKELIEHNLLHTVSGRTITRCVIECYIMMKYLCQEEPNRQNIWLEYQNYGMGQYKLICKRVKESSADMDDTHLNIPIMEAMVNHRINEMYVDMDTSYFDKQGIREKSIAVGEKELWSHFYDYDSAFEHGLWGGNT